MPDRRHGVPGNGAGRAWVCQVERLPDPLFLWSGGETGRYEGLRNGEHVATDGNAASEVVAIRGVVAIEDGYFAPGGASRRKSHTRSLLVPDSGALDDPTTSRLLSIAMARPNRPPRLRFRRAFVTCQLFAAIHSRPSEQANRMTRKQQLIPALLTGAHSSSGRSRWRVLFQLPCGCREIQSPARDAKNAPNPPAVPVICVPRQEWASIERLAGHRATLHESDPE